MNPIVVKGFRASAPEPRLPEGNDMPVFTPICMGLFHGMPCFGFLGLEELSESLNVPITDLNRN